MASLPENPANLEGLMELLALQPESRRRRQILQAGREWWKPETVARFYDEVVRLTRVDLRQAERLARAAAWISAQIGDEGSRAISLRAMGHVLYLKRQYEPALERYQEALAIYEHLGMELDVGRTISGSLQTLIYLGRYDEAFAALTEAHRSQVAYVQTALGKNPADESATISLTKHGTARDDRARWSDQDAPPQADSPVFIVGFPRSGTTLLEQTLDAHPQLVSMDEQPFLRRAADRVNSFALQCPAELGHLSADQLRMIRAEYWQRVEKKIQLRAGQRLVDKNPFNLLRLPLIRRLFPNAQTVLIIRHPCDVLFSCFAQHFRAPDLAMLCRDLPTLAHGYRLSFDYWYEQAPLLQAATYELQYEKFVVDFPAEVRRLAEFLGLPWDDSMLAPADHARSKGYISTPSYSQVIEPVSNKPVGRWKNYEPHFHGVVPELESYLERWGYSI